MQVMQEMQERFLPEIHLLFSCSPAAAQIVFLIYIMASALTVDVFNDSMVVGRSILWHKEQEKHASRLIKWPGCLATQQCLSIVNLHSKKVNKWQAAAAEIIWHESRELCCEDSGHAFVIALPQCRLISVDNVFFFVALRYCVSFDHMEWVCLLGNKPVFHGKMLMGNHQMDERCTRVENIQFQQGRGGLKDTDVSVEQRHRHCHHRRQRRWGTSEGEAHQKWLILF